ncbi:hypothetical protein BH10ACT10_BH10ACT10_14210 [soil metagenome]
MPDVRHPQRRPRRWSWSRPSRGDSTLADFALTVVVRLLVAALVATPVAAGWAVTQTRVEAIVGITPVTFALQPARHSEVRLGIPGTIYLPVSRGPFGVVATVDGPGEPGVGAGDLASFVSPGMLELYTGLFHDPAPAIATYVDLLRRALLHRFLVVDLLLALLGAAAWSAIARSRPRRPSVLQPLGRGRMTVAVGSALVASLGVGALQLQAGASAGRSAEGRYELPVLDGTLAEGSSTNSPLLRLLLGGAVPKVQSLVRRQEQRERAYRDTAIAGLSEQADAITGPRAGETAVLMQSDMHCNTTMIRIQTEVADRLGSRFGDEVPALMAVTGDLTTNGTAAEGGCIVNEARIMGRRPVAAVTGNHESELSAEQMSAAGVQVLTGSTERVGGVTVLGDGDPSRSELFGDTSLRGDESEAGVGRRLYEQARDDKPQLVLVHEAYAAEAFIGTTGMTDFLDGRGSTTEPYDDGVRDLPASAVFYGHWHRSIEPRVVWNDDGTWTLVMELDTSGGAIDTPTIEHFSTPWSQPQQEASFPVVFLDQDSGLVTGYQLYRFDTDGTATALPRVDVGVAPDSTSDSNARCALDDC